MHECKLYPQFFIELEGQLLTEYRKVDGHFEKRTFFAFIDADEPEEWAECSMANYALALLKAHEDQAK